jgi:hypothetical protein
MMNNQQQEVILARDLSPLSTPVTSSSASSLSDMQQEPQEVQVHYNKLKIAYFRKLNILPVLSPSEAEEIVSELGVETSDQSQPSPQNYSLSNSEPFAPRLKSTSSVDSSRMKTFLTPSSRVQSAPIAIPISRSHSSRSHSLSPSLGLPPPRSIASTIPNSVYESDFIHRSGLDDEERSEHEIFSCDLDI